MSRSIPAAAVFCAAALFAAPGCSRQAAPHEHDVAGDMTAAHGMPTTIAEWARGAQLFDGLGNFHRAITTSSPEAQQYFDQGMRLLWAFNHDESTRSFARAAELDPACAMCLWGVALTVGPNYNLPMMAQQRATLAHGTTVQAAKLAEQHAAPVEIALVNALKVRYPSPAALDPTTTGPVLQAYADAMRDVAHRFAADDDVQVMFAEALMNTHAWKLWSSEGTAAPGTDEVVAALETVLKRNAQHPGANHYYVHALEASPHPERAVAAAERLHGLMPAAGHLEHMPAHIMQRVGRYSESAEANRIGVAADRAYLAQTKPLDYYPMYFAHNYDFLAYATAMQGRRAETLSAVKAARDVRTDEMLLSMPGADWNAAMPYLARVRFGDWDGLLAEPRPNSALKMLTGGYLFATTLALVERHRIQEADTRFAELQQVRASLPADATAGLNRASDVLDVAVAVAGARIAAGHGDRDGAIAGLMRAVALEDKLSYDEPADWFFPVRHLLGAALLDAGQAAKAELVYRDDLKRNPSNGWSLFGLAAALRAERKTVEAAAADGQFRGAWKDADIQPKSSAM